MTGGRQRRLRRLAEAASQQSAARVVENPSLFAAWVWMRPPDAFDAPRKRGELVFAEMARLGFRVQVIPQGSGSVSLSIWRPWTYIVCSLPSGDFSEQAAMLADDDLCSVIMDCHFPIMNMGAAIGADDQIIDIIDRKDMLLANLALADAVTVPHPSWAADLAEVNPNVFVLPDYEDRTADRFGIRLAEIAQTSMRVKLERQRLRKEMGL